MQGSGSGKGLSQALTDAVGEKVRDILTRAGAAAAEEAKRRAPVRTGRLRDSIGFHVSEGEDGSAQVQAAVGTDVPYAAAQELGTAKRPGKHFLADGTAAGAAAAFGGR